MDSLRKEIEQEMKRARLDKGRLYDLILKIVDNVGTGGVGPQGPAGPTGPTGPTGPAGPACECKCVSKEVPTKAPIKASTTKKAPAKKKVTV
jgi:hypothetical protein